MGRLLEFFEGHRGTLSSTRLLMYQTGSLIIGTWAWVSVVKNEIQPLAIELVSLMLGTMGLVQAPKFTNGKAKEPNGDVTATQS